MNISYDWYKIFCAAADSGSITTAAERLFISQPAVSQCIHQLESALGCTLFVRTPKGVRLTAEGRTLYGFVSAGVASFAEGERRLTAMLRLDSGEIRIGASDMTLEFFLLPYLAAYHLKYPGVSIAITNNPTPQTMELLRDGKIDFAAVSEPAECAELEAIPVREIRDIFICSPQAERHDGCRIIDLKDELILLEKNTSTRSFTDREFRRRGFFATPRFELATSRQIVSFAAMNLGIGCVVADFAAEAIADGTVREIAVSDPMPKRNICVLSNEREASLAAKVLWEMIRGKDGKI